VFFLFFSPVRSSVFLVDDDLFSHPFRLHSFVTLIRQCCQSFRVSTDFFFFFCPSTISSLLGKRVIFFLAASLLKYNENVRTGPPLSWC